MDEPGRSVLGAAPPVVVGHRGAPRRAPENTPASFLAAAEAGAHWVELDARRSADGVLMCHHDAWIEDGAALVARSADELARAGVWSLAAVLDALPPALGVDVEVKHAPGEPDFDGADQRSLAALAALLRDRRGERRWAVTSFDPTTVAAAVAALPDVPAGLLHLDVTPLEAAAEVAVDVGARLLCPQRGAPGLPEAVAEVHAAGLAVLVWTVDDPEEAVTLADAGADAICTNVPDAVAAALAGR